MFNSKFNNALRKKERERERERERKRERERERKRIYRELIVIYLASSLYSFLLFNVDQSMNLWSESDHHFFSIY